MAGTAATQTHWLFVEAPGGWARKALPSSSLPDDQRRALGALPDHWRVVLVRRPDRPLRSQRERMVWLSAPDGPALRWRLALDEPVVPDALPDGADEVTQATLFVCTNGGRDACCAREGRELFDQAASVARESVWESSHFGGHRFAATAIRLPDRLMFGRLDGQSVREALAGGWPMDCVRGPAGWPAEVQSAAVRVWRQHGVVPVHAAVGGDHEVRLALSNGTNWRVPVTTVSVAERLTSCGTEPIAGSRPLAGTPEQLLS